MEGVDSLPPQASQENGSGDDFCSVGLRISGAGGGECCGKPRSAPCGEMLRKLPIYVHVYHKRNTPLDSDVAGVRLQVFINYKE